MIVPEVTVSVSAQGSSEPTPVAGGEAGRDPSAHLPVIVAAVGIAVIGLEWFAVQLLGIPQTPTIASTSALAAGTSAAVGTPSGTAPLATVDPSVAPPPRFDASMPDALPLPDGVWERTGPGWVLASYEPSRDATGVLGPQVIYLVSPDGSRYRVLDVARDAPIHLRSWSAGDTRAYIDGCSTSSCPSGSQSTAVLDLTTGRVSSLGALGDDGTVVATLPGSRRVWSQASGTGVVEHNGIASPFGEHWSPWTVSPAGDYVSLHTQVSDTLGNTRNLTAIAATVDGALVPLPGLDPAWSCFPDQWVDPTQLLIGCTTSEGLREEVQADVVTGTVVPAAAPQWSLPADAAAVRKDFWIEPGVWAGAYTANGTERDIYGDAGPGDVGISDQGTVRKLALTNSEGLPLDSATVGGLVDHTLYIAGRTFSSGGTRVTTTLVEYDLRTGSEIVLLPEAPTRPAATECLAPGLLETRECPLRGRCGGVL
jgi:hypothetical protein